MRDTNPLTSCKHQGASFTHLTEDPNKRGNIPTNRQEVKRLFIQPAINKNATVNAENATVSPSDTIDKYILPSWWFYSEDYSAEGDRKGDRKGCQRDRKGDKNSSRGDRKGDRKSGGSQWKINRKSYFYHQANNRESIYF